MSVGILVFIMHKNKTKGKVGFSIVSCLMRNLFLKNKTALKQAVHSFHFLSIYATSNKMRE